MQKYDRKSSRRSPRKSPNADFVPDLVSKMKKLHGESPKKKKIGARRGKEKMEEGCLKKTTKTGRDKNEEVNGMDNDSELRKPKDLQQAEEKMCSNREKNDSELGKPKDLQQAEERRCSNRETKESKYKKTPFRENVRTIIPKLLQRRKNYWIMLMIRKGGCKK
ncbi:hypothetical protein LIER_41529 [Lithospermum erythrorhizon]|uniref:Uncharacterized protein n=1 Tax=Lithospermum erythrorhizon TaxID=34254 RepID=A0AAV3RAZ1_LITER